MVDHTGARRVAFAAAEGVDPEAHDPEAYRPRRTVSASPRSARTCPRAVTGPPGAATSHTHDARVDVSDRYIGAS
jgi:hypothetical protein